jgi:hypothetical protein
MKKPHEQPDAGRELASIPTVRQVEAAIKIKASRWPGRCHEIACKMLEAGLVQGVERYGHYYGPVALKHPRCGLPFQRHGWIETPRRLVVDPTRWAFRMVKPYIYYGPTLDYDAGGQRILMDFARPYPAGPKDEASTWPSLLDSPNLTDEQRAERRKIIQLDIPGPARDHLAKLTGGQVADFTFEQVFWMAHVPLALWGEHAGVIYEALAKAGHRAMIPFDNWRMAMEKPMAANLP